MPSFTLPVHPAEAIRVVHGVAQGDALDTADQLVMEDIYELAEGARLEPLTIEPRTQGESGEEAFFVAEGSPVGRPGARLHLDGLIALMGGGGAMLELVLLVETDTQGNIARLHVHPLSPMAERSPYTLVTIDRRAARARLAQSACVWFARGTRITMADGRQVPIEDLRLGDRVLTRDSGPQVLRWVGCQTLRATGALAPITIAPGALNNEGELTVSPRHRLFIYQRVDEVGAGQAEVLIEAHQLVNGVTVTRSEGGFVDYFQLLFDKHEIIYAEGIAAESQFLDPETAQAVPEEVRARLMGSARPEPHGVALAPQAVAGREGGIVELLRRASLR